MKTEEAYKELQHIIIEINEIQARRKEPSGRELSIILPLERAIRKSQQLINSVKTLIGEYSTKTGFKPEKITIRRQKTRWVSCSSSGSISLNLKLICLLENVVHHKVTYLKHRKHNKAFWQTVSQRYPGL
ncbi:MAG: M48 family metallopeptidase [Nitrososphaerota archaeon]|nr:M48 family metallopeptidase [Candidatus Bathyarchaeota archaeon]MDW8049311.1 M48 family metallopeptidase [Nitrososphaerota archaeon]